MTFLLGQFHKRCLHHQSLNPFENYISKISLKFPRGQWVNSVWPGDTVAGLNHGHHWLFIKSVPYVFDENHYQNQSANIHINLYINSLTPGKFEWSFRYVIFKRILVIDGSGISCEIALIWMSLDSTDDQSTLVQIMAWCRQATSHYLSQCWPRSLSS